MSWRRRFLDFEGPGELILRLSLAARLRVPRCLVLGPGVPGRFRTKSGFFSSSSAGRSR